jgi:hypothetical protein
MPPAPPTSKPQAIIPLIAALRTREPSTLDLFRFAAALPALNWIASTARLFRLILA